MPRREHPLDVRAAFAPVSPYAGARAKLNACMRTLYEDTHVPVREIARLAGVSERALYQFARRHLWRLRCPLKGNRRRAPLPKERLPRPARARVSAGSAVARRAKKNLRHAAAERRKVPTVAAQLEAYAAAIFARRKAEAGLRALASVGRALCELARLERTERAKVEARAKVKAEEAAEAADLDARRRELARKIANLANDASEPQTLADPPAIQMPRQAGARIRLLSD